MLRFLKVGLMVLSGILVMGCASTTDHEGAPVEDRPITGDAGGASTSGASGDGVHGQNLGTDPLKDPANILSRRSVFFAFDSYVVEDEYRGLVEAHAQYLAANPTARMTLQGHTDERGTHEYNLALGQRRADAVKRLMVLLGAQDSQIETISFGKERPRNIESNEIAWAENRRVDVLYLGE